MKFSGYLFRKYILFALGIALLASFLTILLISLGNKGLDDSNLRKPNSVILLIGDGMGQEHIKLAKKFMRRESGFSFEKCQTTLVMTSPANSTDSRDLPMQNARQTAEYPSQTAARQTEDPGITDSAAAATAMASGQKVGNGVIGVALPGDGSELRTILEDAKAMGKSTGLVTTTKISDATPAAFAAHEVSRTNEDGIINDYLTQTKPNVIMGGKVTTAQTLAPANGYAVASNSKELAQQVSLGSSHLLGLFGEGPGGHIPYFGERDATTPGLLTMTKSALDLLDNDPEGFFLMVEGGRIDHASHENNDKAVTYELKEFMQVVEFVQTWSEKHGNTLLIVTADHETGGLLVTEDNEAEGLPVAGANADMAGGGKIPAVTWSTPGHTSAEVPLFVCGSDTDLSAVKDNTDVYKLMVRTIFD